jgi:hypothetical protein
MRAYRSSLIFPNLALVIIRPIQIEIKNGTISSRKVRIKHQKMHAIASNLIFHYYTEYWTLFWVLQQVCLRTTSMNPIQEMHHKDLPEEV